LLKCPQTKTINFDHTSRAQYAKGMESPSRLRLLIRKTLYTIGAFLLVLIFLGLIFSSQTPAPIEDDGRAERIKHACQLINVRDFHWSMSEGGFLTGACYIRNENRFAVYDIEVDCHTYGNSGTTINTRSLVIRERIRPGATVLARDLRFGFVDKQTKSADLSVVNFQTDHPIE
jgi:hypothetical protein